MTMRERKKRREAGASLIEVALSILVLVIVMGAVFSQVDGVTKINKRESITTDLVQENRDFVDLFVRDVHMSGYPVSTMYAITPPPPSPQPPNCSDASHPYLQRCDQSQAVGIVFASPTSLRLEGDVYGDGNVYSVLYQYYAVDPNSPPDPNCPCLRRSAVRKIDGDPINGQSTPQFYTEVQNIIDPTGMTQGIFTYYDATGNSISVGTGVDFETNLQTIQSIDAVKVNLNVRSLQKDLQTGQSIVTSLAAIAELEN
jgi:hypothetical protein